MVRHLHFSEAPTFVQAPLPCSIRGGGSKQHSGLGRLSHTRPGKRGERVRRVCRSAWRVQAKLPSSSFYLGTLLAKTFALNGDKEKARDTYLCGAHSEW